jgi:hypothetical protein
MGKPSTNIHEYANARREFEYSWFLFVDGLGRYEPR